MYKTFDLLCLIPSSPSSDPAMEFVFSRFENPSRPEEFDMGAVWLWLCLCLKACGYGYNRPVYTYLHVTWPGNGTPLIKCSSHAHIPNMLARLLLLKT